MTPEEMAALKAQGFVVSTQDDPDFFDMLTNKFLESKPELTKASATNKKFLSGIKEFIDFCKNQLLDNPPVTMTYLDKGLALQFSDYTRSVLVNNTDRQIKPVKSVVITDSDRKGGPLVFKQVDTSIPITR